MKTKNNTVFLFGLHPCQAALNNSNREIFEIITTTPEALQKLLDGQPLRHKHRLVQREWFINKFGEDAVHQGICVQASPLAPISTRDLEGKQNQTVIILDQVEDPHNVGAIIRSAAAFGVAAVVMTDRHAPNESAVLAKSASGALEFTPIIREANLANVIRELKELGFWVYGFAENGTTPLHKAKLNGNVALVMGAESKGMRRLTQELCDVLIKLETSSQFSTLNVSNAAAVALHHAFICQIKK